MSRSQNPFKDSVSVLCKKEEEKNKEFKIYQGASVLIQKGGITLGDNVKKRMASNVRNNVSVHYICDLNEKIAESF